MPTTKLFDFSGNAVSEVQLPDAVFGVEPNTHVMHQHLVRQLANWRAGSASTLTRSEVSGGGKKPWKQKGTGRARAGSIRSPLWKGGGVIFGPKPRAYTQDMPRKMRRLALRSALSAKAADVIAIKDDFSFDKPSTKTMLKFLTSIGARFVVSSTVEVKGKERQKRRDSKVLMVIDGHNEVVERSARNLEGVRLIFASNLNVKDLLNHDKIVITDKALKQIEEVLS